MPVVLSNNKNKLIVHMYIVKNTTIFLIVRLLLNHSVSRPVLGSMQLMDAGDCFPKDKVSLAHHSCPSATTTVTGKPYSGIATTVGAGESGVRISTP